MSPAKRTTTTAKRTSTRTRKAAEQEVALPSESDQMQPEPLNPAVSFSGEQPMRDTDERIRRRAYEIYCSRNGGDGSALEDWLAAEREVRATGTAPERHASVLLESSSEDARRDVAR